MKTAKEFYRDYKPLQEFGSVPVSELMIEFAKMHVEAALKQASEKAFTNVDGTTVNVDSILNAYPLTNIK